MTQITGGTVTYLRRVKTGDYEHKEASATINFSVDDGDVNASISDVAGAQALVLVNRALGIAAPAVTPAEAPVAAPRRGRPAKPPTVEQATPSTAGSVGGEAASSSTAGQTEADPFAAGSSTAGATTSEPAASNDEGLGDLLGGEEPVKEISDKELVDEITAHNHKVNKALDIRKLIGQYVEPPKKAQDIPQDQRQKFLDELHKIV